MKLRSYLNRKKDVAAMVASSPLFCTHCGAANSQKAAFCFACGQRIESYVIPATSVTGTLQNSSLLKGRYSIQGTLGSGGMGSVYKAEDTLFANRLVAVKEMSQSGLSSQQKQEAAADFKREAHILADLHHPNFPTIYDYFSEQGQWYLVMDYVAGETLEQRLREFPGGRLPLKQAIELGIQLCAVLEFLHTRQPPIIFRDLKPANIMCTPDEHYILIDFGIARHFKPGQSKDTVAFGSPGYAAPEQYGKTQTTPRSDIYSLGVILHECLSGHDPATNSPTPFIFPPLDVHGQFVPTSLFSLIAHMLETDADKRPATMPFVLQVLEDILRQVSDHERRQAALRRQAQQVVHTLPPRTPERPIPVPQPPVPIIPTRTFILLNDLPTIVQSIARSPEGNHIVTGGRQGQVQIRAMSTLDVVMTLRGHSGIVRGVSWSPTGTYIASGDDGGLVIVWDVSSGKRVYSYRGYAIATNSLTWSPDGTRIASGDSLGRVLIQDALDGAHAMTYTEHRALARCQVVSVAWSPFEDKIASGDSKGHVHIWETTRHTMLLVYNEHVAPITTLAFSPSGTYIASGDTVGHVHIWKVDSGECVFSFQDHRAAISTLAWSPDGRSIASGSQDRSISLWDAFDGRQLFCYRDHQEAITALLWHPHDASIISADTAQTLRLWEVPASMLQD